VVMIDRINPRLGLQRHPTFDSKKKASTSLGLLTHATSEGLHDAPHVRTHSSCVVRTAFWLGTYNADSPYAIKPTGHPHI